MRGEISKRHDNLKGTLEIRDMQFIACHGLHREERLTGGKFSVTCRMDYPVDPGSDLKTLEQTIDYQEVFQIVADIMIKPVNLIEELTKTIYDAVLEKYPDLTFLYIRVEKRRPPIKGLGMTAFELSSYQ